MILRDGVMIELTEGGFRAVDVPTTSDNQHTAERLFEEASKLVCAEWNLRGKHDSERRRWLQNVAYGVLARMLENGFGAAFDERIRRVGRRVVASNRRLRKQATLLLMKEFVSLRSNSLGAPHSSACSKYKTSTYQTS